MAHVTCPFWVGYLLASPIRKLAQNPKTILSPYIKEGMRALDVGCAMGFFSLPIAQMVGPTGRVFCVDMQERMLKALERRCRKERTWDRVTAIRCTAETLGLNDMKETVDFALAFAVVHEVQDPRRFLAEIQATLKPSGLLLIAEPSGHVRTDEFEKTVALTKEAGFSPAGTPTIRRSRTILLRKR